MKKSPTTKPNALLRLALVLAALCGQPACRTDIQAGIESANELLFQEKYLEAERLYRKALKRLEGIASRDDAQDAQMLVVLDRLGKINGLYLNDYTQALADYDTLVRRFPRTPQAFAARAMAADIHRNKLGNIKAAVDEYQRLVAEFPDLPETRRPQLQIAAAYFQLKDYEQARTEAKALIDKWPTSPEATQARIQIANSYFAQGRFSEAMAVYQGVLDSGVDTTTQALMRFEIGNCLQELGEAEPALEQYYKSLAEHPNPNLVQRKIMRVRARISKTRPSDSIISAARPPPATTRAHHVAASAPKAKGRKPDKQAADDAAGAPLEAPVDDEPSEATEPPVEAGSPESATP